MKASILGLCRGDAKIYVKVSLNGLTAESAVEVSVTGDGGSALPCDSYLLSEQPKNEAERNLAVVIPLLTVGSQQLIFAEYREGNFVSTASIALSMNKAKWESRLNYRLHKDLCDEIRGYDDATLYKRIQFMFYEGLRDGDGVILRGFLWMPALTDPDVELSCFDSNGQPIPIAPITLADETYASSDETGIIVHDIAFSVRLPLAIDYPTFYARDLNNPQMEGFSSVEPARYHALIAKGDDMLANAVLEPKYDTWFQWRKVKPAALEEQAKIDFEQNASFSIIVPLFRTPIDLFEAMLASVEAQSYANWQLVLVNASPEDAALADAVRKAAEADDRVLPVDVESNRGITENTNVGIEHCSGDFVCFFDHDDLLEPDVLFEYAKALDEDPAIDLFYCDEDKIKPDGTHIDPFFKPDFSIDLLRNNNYICHLLTVRKSIIDELEPATSVYDGAQDHNLTLRVVEKTSHVHHVPRILYHWRITENSTAANADAKPYASQAGIRSVQEHLDRLGIPAKVTLSSRPFTYSVKYLLTAEPLVSIIIPNRDNTAVLDTCIQSIREKTTYQNYEIVIVENNSTEEKTFAYYENLQKQDDRIRIVTWEHEFNFSKLINFGAQQAKGDYLLLLNNDTEVISPAWMETLLAICTREDVGAVGPRLLYRNDTIQHAGIIIESQLETAVHAFYRLPKSNFGYFAFADDMRNYSAVTGACLMTKKKAFDLVGGFTEELAVAYNDVDYCLKLRDNDLLIVYTPDVELYHYESMSRGSEGGADRKIAFYKEKAYLHYHWAEYFVNGDPYFNPNLKTDYFKLKD